MVEDALQRMLVHSSHGALTDAIRQDSILRRSTPPEVIEWFRTYGIRDAPGAVRIPPSDALATLGRVCIPIRHERELLGFLWLIDDDGRMHDAEIALAEAAARTAAVLVRGSARRAQLASELVRELLTAPSDTRTAAAAALVDLGVITDRHAVSVVVIRADGSGDAAVSVASDLDLMGASVLSPEVVRAVIADHVALVVPEPVDAAALASGVRDALVRRRRSGVTSSLTVGIGPRVVGLIDAYTSYRNARRATDAARAVDQIDSVAAWDDLGPWRLLALTSPDTRRAALDPRLEPLAAPSNRELLDTAAVWFDAACDVARTAARLHVHRATIYQRLHRIETLCGLDFGAGDDRLSAHLGVKLLQFDASSA